MVNRSLSVVLLIAATAFSCKRDMPVDPVPSSSQTFVAGQGVFITNEGTFQFGNASISYYNFTQGVTSGDIFSSENGFPLGDVCQSMTVIGNYGYIVVNNSGKIEVVNMSDFSIVATITGFTSPRYLIPVSPTKAYVSDLFGDGLTILDLTTNTITGEIPMPGWTERMLISNGKVFVTCYETDKLYIVNPATDLLADSIAVSKGGNSLVEDVNGKIWLMCAGDFTTSTPGALYRIDSAADSVEWSASFISGHYPGNLVINSTASMIYYVDGDVFAMSVADTILPSAPSISANGRTLYGLGIHSSTNEIYVSDAVDYVQNGRVYRFSSSFVLLDDFPAGVVPGSFCFY